MNATAFTVVTVQPNCTAAILVNCSYSGISNGADAAAKAILGTTAFSSFTHYTYILPPGFESICGWSGLALLPGKQTWLQVKKDEDGARGWETGWAVAGHPCWVPYLGRVVLCMDGRTTVDVTGQRHHLGMS